MGIINREEVVAWESSEGILCDDCADCTNDKPLLNGGGGGISDEDIVICDRCDKRIQ